MLRKKLLILLAALAAHNSLTAQSIQEILDLPSDYVTFNASSFVETTVQVHIGEKALITDYSSSQVATLELTPTQSGIFSFWTLESGSYISMYFERQVSGNWNYINSLSPYNWNQYHYFVQAGSTYRIRATRSSSSSAVDSYAVIDAAGFVPIIIGDLQAAANTNLPLANEGAGVWYSQTAESSDGVSSLRSTPLSSGQAILRATVTGPALLSFRCKTSSTSIGVNVSINDNSVYNTSSISWVTRELLIPAGEHAVRWETSGSSSGQDACFVDEISVESFPVSSVNEALDTDLINFRIPWADTWLTSGANGSLDGEDALVRSFYSSTSGSSEVDQGSLEGLIQGPAILRFFWKSQNTTQSFFVGKMKTFEPHWNQMGSSSSGEWQSQQITLSPGAFHLRWGFDGNYYYSGYRSTSLDMMTVVPLETVDLKEALDNSKLVWHSGPEGQEWWGQKMESFDFKHAAASPLIPSYGESWIQTVIDGPGTLNFRWMREYQGSSSYDNETTFTVYSGKHLPYNGIEWVVLGDLIQSSSSNPVWQTSSLDIPAGRQQVAWQVERHGNQNSSRGGYLFYMDDVRFASTSTGKALRASVKVEGLMWSPWLGWYGDEPYPWIYNRSLGWVRIHGSDDSNIYYYDESAAKWYWTCEGVFPWLYDMSGRVWVSQR